MSKSNNGLRINGRMVLEELSSSPVTRVVIRPDEMKIRYSETATADFMADVYSVMVSLVQNIPTYSPTCRLKILDTDDLRTLQVEYGSAEYQTKIIKYEGKDYQL